jgi:hypothetical protein
MFLRNIYEILENYTASYVRIYHRNELQFCCDVVSTVFTAQDKIMISLTLLFINCKVIVIRSCIPCLHLRL